jgi:hypothetical protein
MSSSVGLGRGPGTIRSELPENLLPDHARAGQKKAGFVPARVTRPTWPARPVNSPRRMREDATRDHHRPKEMLNFFITLSLQSYYKWFRLEALN